MGNEGSVWEMAWFAAQQKLDNLTIIVDHNKMQAMGFSKDVMDPIDLANRWKSFGWEVVTVDGHSVLELAEALRGSSKEAPRCIIANTIKGKGVSFMENNLLWHYRDPQGEDYMNALSELGGV